MTLTIIKGKDWEGVYDWQERLIGEGHTIDWPKLLQEFCGLIIVTSEVDEEWLEERGGLPGKLSEVKRK